MAAQGQQEQEGGVWDISSELFTSFEQLKALKEKEGAKVSWKDIDADKFEENPYGYIQELFAKRETMAPSLPSAVWESQVLDALHLKYTERRLEKGTSCCIPSLNDHDTVKVKNGQVVRFRCMIQDDLGSEYSAAEYSVTNPVTGDVKTETTLLRDFYEMDEEDINPSLTEKDAYVAISPPGENFWVSQETKKDSEAVVETKRTRVDENETNEEFISLPNYKDIVPSLFSNIGDAKPTACVLKMYKYDEVSWKHNDLLEVIGLIQIPNGETAEESADDGVSYPELGKLPVIHVFSYIKLADGNPNIPLLDEKMFLTFPLSDIRVLECAEALRDLFALALGGDRYAAAYAMIAVVARAHFVENQLSAPVGKFVLNLSGIPETSRIVESLMYIIKALVPRTVKLQFGIESLNTMNLVPIKNMNTNQLEPGLLQLPVGTHMIIDETVLQPGNFNEAGTRNLLVMRELLIEQKVMYDYTYQFPKMEANFPTIILSGSSTVLPVDIRVEVNAAADYDETYARTRIERILSEKGEMLRNYLTMQRFIRLPNRLFDYKDSTLMTDITEYLSHRNNSTLYKSKMSATEYSAFITSCRSWCMMQGSSHITRDGFMFWKELERIRDSRIPRYD